MEQGGEAELIDRMKNSVQMLSSSAQNYGDLMLMRFLVARSMDPEKAAKMFVQWQKWRADIAPLGYIPDSEVLDELGAKKIYLGGPTESGHPILIVKASKHYPSKDHLQFKKFVVHLLDKTIASAHKGTEAFYPERLARCFILHMPRFFVSVWRIVSRFLEKETLEKIIIVTNEEEMRSFIEQIGEEALPECYGGKAKLVALQDVVLTPPSA